MAPRLSGQTSIFGVVFFVFESLLEIERQKKLKEFTILTRKYEGLLQTKYRICIYPCYVGYMNAMRNKSISKHVRYKLKVSDKTKRCPTQVKDVR